MSADFVVQAMNRELNRLASYADWPMSSSAWPSRLARCGFYATGVGETAACFSCALSVTQWHIGDDPKQKHRADSPDCSVANGRDSTNVPMAALCDDFDRGIRSDAVRPNVRVNRDVKDSGADTSSTEPVRIYDVARAALSRARQKGLMDTQPPTHTVDTENPNFELLRREGARLATFTNFPTSSPMTPAALAKAGFFHKGPQDRVQCAFCQLLLRNWVAGDDAMAEHRRHNGECPFVTNSAHHGNVCIEDDDGAMYTAVQRVQRHTSDSPSAQQGTPVSILFSRIFCLR